MKSITTKYGQSHTTSRTRYLAHYSGGARKINIIMAIDAGCHWLLDGANCSRRNPRRWVMITEENCDQYVFGNFINTILHSIESYPAPENVDQDRVLLWDNLSLHKIPYVMNLIYNRETNDKFSVVNYPPYRPRIALIEYIFVR